MEFEVIIKPDGKIVSQVIDRGTQNCAEILKITNVMGRQISDERTGPDDDKVNEIVR